MSNSPSKNDPRSSQGTLLQRRLAVLLCSVLLCACALVGCASPATSEDSSTAQDNSGVAAPSSDAVEVKVGSLKGPTSIGLVNFMERAEQESASLQNSYDFSIVGTADELAPQLINGELDIALVPANLAATLYNRTQGEIIALDINTLGVLYVVSSDESLTSLEQLAGRTVLMTGKGTTPDYVMNFLLEQSGLSDDVTLEFKSEATEVAAALAADPLAVAVLPEPYVTSVCTKNESLAPRISLTDAWAEATAQSGENGQLVTGVTVARLAFANENPQVIEEFLEQQALSVTTALSDVDATAELVVKQGIVDNAAIAKNAIPRCNLVCIDGNEMEQALSGYLQVLFNKDPDSIGGSMPGADFYYHLTE